MLAFSRENVGISKVGIFQQSAAGPFEEDHKIHASWSKAARPSASRATFPTPHPRHSRPQCTENRVPPGPTSATTPGAASYNSEYLSPCNRKFGVTTHGLWSVRRALRLSCYMALSLTRRSRPRLSGLTALTAPLRAPRTSGASAPTGSTESMSMLLRLISAGHHCAHAILP